MAMESDRRKFPRLVYPEDRRPAVVINAKEGGGEGFKAKDISEQGMCFIGPEECRLQINSRIEAQIAFSDGETLSIVGVVLRIGGNQAAAYLLKGIPASRLDQERELLEG